jgi:SAM-dependent methyltransferase
MTISPGQIAEAQRRHRDQKVQYHCGDYHQLPFPDVSLDGIFYLESLCHSTRPNEALGEAARCLKAGSRIVMTDGFIQRPLEETSPAFRYVVHAVADNWAVPMFHNIQQARSWSGRNDLKLVEEIECGWRLGPSALHAAHLSLFYFVKLLASRKVDSWQWKHLKASAFTIALGLYRRHFRYHMLAFEKITPRGDASS